VVMSAGVRPMSADRESPPAAPLGRGRRSRGLALGALRRVTLNWPGVLAALVLWELLPRLGVLPAESIPPASEVLPRFAGLLGDASFWSSVGFTLRGWAVGLGISILLATPLGLLIGSNAYLDRATRATIEFLRPVPSVALLPLAILVLGISMDMKIFLVAFATFWPILVQAIYGVQDVDPVARDTARSFGVGRLAIFFRVTLPSAAPYLATGLRVASALGIILAITAEMVAGVPGLGQEILLAQSGGANDLMYALILATGLISLGLSAALRRAERYALRWHVSYREVASA
jgi:ABC-type nitrate/sulfonate/bicarbonate transport system permease component